MFGVTSAEIDSFHSEGLFADSGEKLIMGALNYIIEQAKMLKTSGQEIPDKYSCIGGAGGVA